MEFDYIIVGAGSAGCVLAARITEDPKISVLLLEAGGENNSLWINMPAALSIPMNMKSYNWGFLSEPEPNLNNRRITCPRGKGLGGTSSINGMAWVRGNPLDYENWVNLGAKGWKYKDVLPYFCRAENLAKTTSPWRGNHGPVKITRGVQTNPLYETFVAAGKAAGYPVTDDPNGYLQEGFGPMEMSVGNGNRYSTARAYLKPARNRSNLCVLKNAHVNLLNVKQRQALGVTFDRGNSKRTATARREIILAAGAIGSPQLLMVSGIGPANHLQETGIPVIENLPGVGCNLMDHLEIYMQQACKKPVTLYGTNTGIRRIAIGLRWLFFRDGLGASNQFESGAFIRSRPGLPWPNIQYHFLPMAITYDGKVSSKQHGYQVHVGPMRSKSRGTVRLRSPSLNENPLLHFNYMNHTEDWEDFRACVRLTREIFNQEPFNKYRGQELAPGPNIQTNEDIDNFIKERAESAYHPCGTCRMGEKNDRKTVTDTSGRVLGISGLRVVDASIIPQITTGNLNAPVIMLAEKIADVIRGYKPLPPSELEFYQADDWELKQR